MVSRGCSLNREMLHIVLMAFCNFCLWHRANDGEPLCSALDTRLITNSLKMHIHEQATTVRFYVEYIFSNIRHALWYTMQDFKCSCAAPMTICSIECYFVYISVYITCITYIMRPAFLIMLLQDPETYILSIYNLEQWYSNGGTRTPRGT